MHPPLPRPGRSSQICPICNASASSPSPSTFCRIADDWANDERMGFLTSYIASDDSNDVSDHQADVRQQMVSFWSKAILHAYECASGLSLDVGVLANSSLAWHGAVAPGLEIAVRRMISTGTLVFRGDIEVEKGWARRLVETPLVYLFGKLELGGSKSSLPNQQYVHRDILEGLTVRLVQYSGRLAEDERTVYLNAHSLQQNAAYTVEEGTPPWSFQQLCRAASQQTSRHCHSSSSRPSSMSDGTTAGLLLSKLVGDDLTLLAEYMVRTKRAVREDGVLKVVARGGGAASGAGRQTGTAAGISETDKDLLRIRCTVASLQASACALERQVNDLKRDALKANREGQKRAALVHMKRMKQCQAAWDNRLSALYTLEQALHQVHRLRVDKQVLEAHEAATKALKAYREGLTQERVEDTLDALAEEMAEQQAIGNALAQDLASHDPDEEAELEQELEELLRGDDVNVGTTTTPVPPTAHDAVVPTLVKPKLPLAKPSRGPEDVLSNAGDSSGKDRASSSTGSNGRTSHRPEADDAHRIGVYASCNSA